jgi:hypothetical protein
MSERFAFPPQRGTKLAYVKGSGGFHSAQPRTSTNRQLATCVGKPRPNGSARLGCVGPHVPASRGRRERMPTAGRWHALRRSPLRSPLASRRADPNQSNHRLAEREPRPTTQGQPTIPTVSARMKGGCEHRSRQRATLSLCDRRVGCRAWRANAGAPHHNRVTGGPRA